VLLEPLLELDLLLERRLGFERASQPILMLVLPDESRLLL
jgi:hypothetical protein